MPNTLHTFQKGDLVQVSDSAEVCAFLAKQIRDLDVEQRDKAQRLLSYEEDLKRPYFLRRKQESAVDLEAKILELQIDLSDFTAQLDFYKDLHTGKVFEILSVHSGPYKDNKSFCFRCTLYFEYSPGKQLGIASEFVRLAETDEEVL